MYASVMAALLLIGCSTSALAQDTADFWAARDTVLAHGPGHSNVRVGIWDSGVDTTLFRDKLARDANGTLILGGYDAFKERQDIPMAVLPDSIAARSSELGRQLRALDDLGDGIDSEEAMAFKAWIDAQAPEEQDRSYASIDRYSGYVHGTAVADIALAGLADAEIVIARMEWWHGSPPLPCWCQDSCMLKTKRGL